MKHHYILADVFTDRLFGGNQLAVFLDDEGLTSEQMQSIAAELNLSETTFLGKPAGPDGVHPLRIFTPKVELPFAGHPTVGTALAMAWAGLFESGKSETSVVFQEGVGPVDVRVRWQNGVPQTATLTVQGPAEAGPVPDAAEVAALLGLRAEDIGFGNEPHRRAIRSLSLGVPFTLVPVRDRSVLGQAGVDQGRWQAAFADTWAPQFFVFTDDAEGTGVDIRARMFAPAMGIVEDPATGAAASTMAAYLAAASPDADGSGQWTIEQGIEMGRPSLIEIGARWKGGEVTAVQVGGGAVKVGEGSIEIPAAN